MPRVGMTGIWVAVTGPRAHKLVAPFHKLRQQRVPCIEAAGMGRTTAHDVCMGGTTSVHWLRRLGHVALPALTTAGHAVILVQCNFLCFFGLFSIE